MNCEHIVEELGRTLGIELKLSKEGTCGVYFDDDEVIFEQHGKQLYLIADLGSAAARSDAYERLLSANYLGHETGQAALSIDENHGGFVLHRIVDGAMEFEDFEKILVLFIQAVRYWKEWLALSPANAHAKPTRFFPDGLQV